MLRPRSPFFAVMMIAFLKFRGPVLGWQLGVSNYELLLAGSYWPLFNTLILATVAALVATVLGTPIGYIVTRHRSRWSAVLDVIGMVPFAVSGTVLAIGMLIALHSGYLQLTGGGLSLVSA